MGSRWSLLGPGADTRPLFVLAHRGTALAEGWPLWRPQQQRAIQGRQATGGSCTRTEQGLTHP